MYILGISGSPRRGGNTETLLDEALSGAREAGAKCEKIVLNELKMVPCQECETVKDDGTCKIEDDFQIVYSKIKKADGIIVASPIFFGSLSAQTKIMIDRYQCEWRYKNILKKTRQAKKKHGGFICVEASDREDFINNAKSIIKNFFVTTDIKYNTELIAKGLEKKTDASTRPDLLKQAYALGKSLVQ